MTTRNNTFIENAVIFFAHVNKEMLDHIAERFKELTLYARAMMCMVFAAAKLHYKKSNVII
ncbi:MAG: hypothetical protein J6B75_09100 [Ruminococcus sp.]|nr:hypothetical protein [Ruminococcus sp.]